MQVSLSKLSKPQLKELYKLINNAHMALKPPPGIKCELLDGADFCFNFCPHCNYCEFLLDLKLEVEKEYNSRPY